MRRWARWKPDSAVDIRSRTCAPTLSRHRAGALCLPCVLIRRAIFRYAPRKKCQKKFKILSISEKRHRFTGLVIHVKRQICMILQTAFRQQIYQVEFRKDRVAQFLDIFDSTFRLFLQYSARIGGNEQLLTQWCFLFANFVVIFFDAGLVCLQSIIDDSKRVYFGECFKF